MRRSSHPVSMCQDRLTCAHLPEIIWVRSASISLMFDTIPINLHHVNPNYQVSGPGVHFLVFFSWFYCVFLLFCAWKWSARFAKLYWGPSFLYSFVMLLKIGGSPYIGQCVAPELVAISGAIPDSISSNFGGLSDVALAKCGPNQVTGGPCLCTVRLSPIKYTLFIKKR